MLVKTLRCTCGYISYGYVLNERALKCPECNKKGEE